MLKQIKDLPNKSTLKYKSRPIKVAILDPKLPEKTKMYTLLMAELAKENITLNVHRWRKEATSGNDLILLASPMYKHFSKEERVLGQRTINRKERLDIIDEIDNTINARWASPKNNMELEEIAQKWGVDKVVLKYDWSAGRRGVYLLSKTKNTFKLPQNFDPSKDIIMEYLSEDPYTYKAELLAGCLLNSWVLKTRSIESEQFNDFSPEPSLFKIPAHTEKILKKISLDLLAFGVGYSSYDLMKKNGELLLIEVNTNTVGTNISWGHFFDQYAKSYPIAIKTTINHIDKIPKLKHLYNDIGKWRESKYRIRSSRYLLHRIKRKINQFLPIPFINNKKY